MTTAGIYRYPDFKNFVVSRDISKSAVSIQNKILVSRGYRDTANFRPCTIRKSHPLGGGGGMAVVDGGWIFPARVSSLMKGRDI